MPSFEEEINNDDFEINLKYPNSVIPGLVKLDFQCIYFVGYNKNEIHVKHLFKSFKNYIKIDYEYFLNNYKSNFEFNCSEFSSLVFNFDIFSQIKNNQFFYVNLLLEEQISDYILSRDFNRNLDKFFVKLNDKFYGYSYYLPYHLHVPLTNIDSEFTISDILSHMESCNCSMFDESTVLSFSNKLEAKNSMINRNKFYINPNYYINNVKYNIHGKSLDCTVPIFCFDDLELDEDEFSMEHLLVYVNNEEEIKDFLMFDNDYYIEDYYIYKDNKFYFKNICSYYNFYYLVDFPELTLFLSMSNVDTNSTIQKIMDANL